MFTMYQPPHPGEIIKELYLKHLDITITQLASQLAVSRNALSSIINGHASISPEMAVKLSIAFDTTPESWLNLQSQFDLWRVQQSPRRFRLIHKVKPINRAKYQMQSKELEVISHLERSTG
ncbi:MAG: HigA family addiction module antidote protein [Parcubacteria group bacterium]|nr:HigA family addiction module antidote protein [Parcubacteria group bacterium]